MAGQTRDKDSDTIAAIATAPGLAGIGIVRISGPESLEIAEALFEGARRPSALKGFEAAYGWVRKKQERIDETVLLVMRSPLRLPAPCNIPCISDSSYYLISGVKNRRLIDLQAQENILKISMLIELPGRLCLVYDQVAFHAFQVKIMLVAGIPEGQRYLCICFTDNITDIFFAEYPFMHSLIDQDEPSFPVFYPNKIGNRICQYFK